MKFNTFFYLLTLLFYLNDKILKIDNESKKITTVPYAVIVKKNSAYFTITMQVSDERQNKNDANESELFVASHSLMYKHSGILSCPGRYQNIQVLIYIVFRNSLKCFIYLCGSR